MRTLVAIPCFNEEVAVGSVVVQAKPYGDVLVIDDGSKDRTAAVAKLAGAEVLIHPKNSGKGKAVQNAFKHARDNGYDCVVLLDGDGQHDPAEIPLFQQAISSGVDVALGFRFGENTEMPGWRRAGKRVLDYATAAGGGGEVTDSQCGFRAFGKKAIPIMAEKLGAEGFGVESEQLVVANQAGLSKKNVTIHCRYDGVDGSTKGPVAHAVGVLGSIVTAITARRPLIYLGIPSLVVLLAAVAMGIYTIQEYNRTEVFSIGWALTTATAALLGTFGMLSAFVLNLVVIIERRLEKLA